MYGALNAGKRCRAGETWLAFPDGPQGRVKEGTTGERFEPHPRLQVHAGSLTCPSDCPPGGSGAHNSPGRTNAYSACLRNIGRAWSCRTAAAQEARLWAADVSPPQEDSTI